MLENIGTQEFEFLSTPDACVLAYLDRLLTVSSDPVLYEVGVGIGATTLEIVRRLNNRWSVVLFSREKI